MKAKDLREKSQADLAELEKTLAHDSFQNRFKNFTNRLDDTSAIKKARKDLARVKTILAELEKKVAHAAHAGGAAAEGAPKAAPKAAKKAPAKKAAAAPIAAKSSPKVEAAKAESAGEEKPAKAKRPSTKTKKAEAK